MERRSAIWGAAALGGTLVAAIVGSLVFRSLFVAIPQSYDALLYGRSLWGVATDHPFNTVYGTHWLGIHANLVFFVLAPLARLVEPVAILAAMSALSLGACATLVGGALGVAAPARSATVAFFGAFVAGLLTPLVTNAYLFDARPEALAVPLLVAGLLRARARNEFDLLALGLVAAAGAVREEFAIIGAVALVVAPIPWACRRAASVRVVFAAALLGCAAAYVLWLRPALDSGFAGERAATAADDLFGWGDAATWRYRGTLLVSLAATGGGLTLAGWRWLGVAGAGLAFCLAIDKHPDAALRFHYLMLLAPGLLLAFVDGFSRLRHGHTARLALAIGAGLLLTWHHGALPGGRTYDDAFFAVFDRASLADVGEARDVVAAIPDEAGVALPYIVASTEADRASIYSMETLRRTLRASNTLPDGVEFVGLLAADFESLGRFLVHQRGLVLVAYLAGRFALLTTRPIDASATLPGISCAGRLLVPVASWPRAGLDLVALGEELVLLRNEAVPGAGSLLPARRTAAGAELLPPLSGLIRVDQIPVGCTATLGVHPVSDWVLVAPSGEVLESETPSGP
jgi:hypothetical protein